MCIRDSYTTAWAAEKCDIDQEVIEALAEKYATGGPAYLCFGYGGSDKFSNPDIQGHAMVILTALTGQIGKPGAALGHPGGGQGYGAALAAWPLPEDMVPADIPVRADRFADTDAGVHVIISLGNKMCIRDSPRAYHRGRAGGASCHRLLPYRSAVGARGGASPRALQSRVGAGAVLDYPRHRVEHHAGGHAHPGDHLLPVSYTHL